MHSLQDGEPYCLLDSTTWQMCPQAVAGPLTAASHDFCVTGVLGAQGLCKSAFLNRLLGRCGRPCPCQQRQTIGCWNGGPAGWCPL